MILHGPKGCMGCLVARSEDCRKNGFSGNGASTAHGGHGGRYRRSGALREVVERHVSGLSWCWQTAASAKWCPAILDGIEVANRAAFILSRVGQPAYGESDGDEGAIGILQLLLSSMLLQKGA